MVAMGRNRIAALACAAIAAILFFLTFQFEEMPESITQGLGAEFFPRLVLGLILLLCVLLALGPDEEAAPSDGEASSNVVPLTPNLFATGAALVGYMALLEPAGMLASMLVFLFGVGWLWGERRIWLLLATSTGLTAVIWGVFVKGFGIQLPQGSLMALAGY